jgi:predicted dehydrogenase
LDQALIRWRPEAVIVSNPTALHLEVAIPSAEAGCHLLIEKPVSHSMDGIEKLKEALKRGGGETLVGFQFRFHPGLRALKRYLEEGAIGRVVSARVNWGEYLPDWHPWEDYRFSYSARSELGGGVLLTLCHPFDYLLWLVGEVESVSAEVGTLGALELEVEDTAEVLLSFKEGVLANVHLDYNQRPASHWLEIVGTEGTIKWNNADGKVRCWSSVSDNWQDTPAPNGFERNDMFLDEMRYFLDILDGEATSLCSLEDGIRVLEIVLAAYESASSGRRVALK